jgi:hypothetical protein
MPTHTPHPLLLDHTPIVPLQAALGDLRSAIDAIEDWTLAFRRARQTVDPDGQHPLYDPHRQQERAAADGVRALHADVDRLFLVLSSATKAIQELPARQEKLDAAIARDLDPPPPLV